MRSTGSFRIPESNYKGGREWAEMIESFASFAVKIFNRQGRQGIRQGRKAGMGSAIQPANGLDGGRCGRQSGYISVENFPDFVGTGS